MYQSVNKWFFVRVWILRNCDSGIISRIIGEMILGKLLKGIMLLHID